MGEERRASPPWDAGLWGSASQNHPKERGTAAFTISFLLPPDFQFLSFSLGIPIQFKGLAPLKIPEAAWAAQAELRAHSLLLGKGSPLGALQSHPSPLESPSFWVGFLVAKLRFYILLLYFGSQTPCHMQTSLLRLVWLQHTLKERARGSLYPVAGGKSPRNQSPGTWGMAGDLGKAAEPRSLPHTELWPRNIAVAPRSADLNRGSL